MGNVSASWSISLDLECPECHKHIDLIDDDWFRESMADGALELLEHGTDRTRGIKMQCPCCPHTFLIDLEY